VFDCCDPFLYFFRKTYQLCGSEKRGYVLYLETIRQNVIVVWIRLLYLTSEVIDINQDSLGMVTCV